MKKIVFDLKEVEEFSDKFIDINSGIHEIQFEEEKDKGTFSIRLINYPHDITHYLYGKIEEEEKMVERKIVPKYEVTKGIKVILLNAMKDLAAGIPIKWDRVVEGDQRVSVYGWILKDASHFDFVMIYIDLIPGILNYVTSSVKYSKKMLVNWDGTDINHVDCITFDEFFRDVVDGQ